ncbi:hypothetical protein [Novosphingobium sp. ZW T3_23]|uniref:hypothetical protein n=1 Tax=Novosphingobium sp. ZW T3_23 TaxID=3378084 RepID=UPI003854F393
MRIAPSRVFGAGLGIKEGKQRLSFVGGLLAGTAGDVLGILAGGEAGSDRLRRMCGGVYGFQRLDAALGV